jgi:glycosyltransferase involved in cell wall biosynthesis
MKLADICLIVEGGYPYLLGGVASWVDSLLRALPQYRFHVVAIRNAAQARVFRFELPPNVVGLHDVVLDGRVAAPRLLFSGRSVRPGLYDCFQAVLSGEDAMRLRPLVMEIGERRIGSAAMLDSRQAWRAMEDHYHAMGAAAPLLDFFWAWRFLLRSLVCVASAALPPARLYHATSTGYAGLLGARAKCATGRPFLLTEHGIYTNERRIEICSADWIYESETSGYSVIDRNLELRDIWLNTFQACSTMAYAEADAITGQYRANQLSQIQDGAPPSKLRLIPNGVDVALAAPEPRVRSAADRPTVLLVARIVPIKDVRTFILAARILAGVVPGVECLVIGPDDENPQYAADCRALVRRSGLENVVTFLGRVPDLFAYYRRADVMALTSLSEAQPLALLEAGATGLPAVTTDVGSCSEILGLVGDDGFGQAGYVVPAGDWRAFAEAAARLLLDPGLRARMGGAMRERVLSIYNQDRVRGLYADFYEEFFAQAERIDGRRQSHGRH